MVPERPEARRVYCSPSEYELRPGGAYRGFASEEVKAEGFRRLTWAIEPGKGGVTSLTVTHELDRAPKTAEQVSGKIPEAGGGWSYILSDLKTLLETGKALGG